MFQYGLISVSVAPLRQKPNHRSEQVSQLLFGERITVSSQAQGAWIQVINDYDGYEGWMLKSQFTDIATNLHRKNLLFYTSGNNDFFCSHSGKRHIRLSPGSDLFLMKNNQINWLDETVYTFKGKRLNKNRAIFSQEHLKSRCEQFLGSPYQWGGRSIYGIDCSGLSQIVFKLIGYKLPRDAGMQARIGETIHFLQDAQCGDLAFFDNDEGRINHVGILLDQHTIIHASEQSGSVVIDSIDAEGIISHTHKMRTHKLRFVNRYFNS